MTKFLLIRHAVNDLVGHRFAGRMPGVHLNEAGLRQANDLAERLKHLPIKAIYSSPLDRAVETARPISQALQLGIIIEKSFNEIDFGDWTNMEISELKDDVHFSRFNSFRSGTRIPNGETIVEVQARITNAFERLRKVHRNGVFAIFSHADVIRAAIAYYAGMPPDFMLRLSVAPASVSVLQIGEDACSIGVLNHCGDLTI